MRIDCNRGFSSLVAGLQVVGLISVFTLGTPEASAQIKAMGGPIAVPNFGHSQSEDKQQQEPETEPQNRSRGLTSVQHQSVEPQSADGIVVHRQGDQSFDTSNDSEKGILLRTDEKSEWHKQSNGQFRLDKGQVLMSVSKPSRAAVLCAGNREVLVQEGAVAFISWKLGQLTVLNLGGSGPRVKIRQMPPRGHSRDLEDTTVSVPNDKVIGLMPGYEISFGEETDQDSHRGMSRGLSVEVPALGASLVETSIEDVCATNELLRSITAGAEADQQVTAVIEKTVASKMRCK
jgi:hypothetical protein